MSSIDVYAIPGFCEPVSCLSHLLAIPVFAILGYFLVRQGRGSSVRTISLSIMVVTTLFLLSMSAIFHLLAPGAGRSIMRQLDMAGVFALIAGTVTPLHAILFRGFHRWAPLVIVWSAAVTGIALKNLVWREPAPALELSIFLLMGWGGFISCIVLWRRYGFSFVAPLLYGGIAYTLGVVVLALQRPVLIQGVFGPHELWHVAVLIGLALHWQFTFQFAGGPPPVELPATNPAD